jgi:hypothetical protein
VIEGIAKSLIVQSLIIIEASRSIRTVDCPRNLHLGAAGSVGSLSRSEGPISNGEIWVFMRHILLSVILAINLMWGQPSIKFLNGGVSQNVVHLFKNLTIPLFVGLNISAKRIRAEYLEWGEWRWGVQRYRKSFENRRPSLLEVSMIRGNWVCCLRITFSTSSDTRGMARY